MKGIENCAECAYYSMKTHKCSRGAKIDPELSKGDDVRYFADCPLCEAEPVVHGWWCDWSMYNEPEYECSECNGISKKMYDYCPHCGAKMGGD